MLSCPYSTSMTSFHTADLAGSCFRDLEQLGDVSLLVQVPLLAEYIACSGGVYAHCGEEAVMLLGQLQSLFALLQVPSWGRRRRGHQDMILGWNYHLSSTLLVSS